jgi:hypothetical protein
MAEKEGKMGTNIVLANSINIKYDDYKLHRKACTRKPR